MALPTPTLETARLRLRPCEESDVDDLFALMSDAEVLRHWDSPPWTDPAQAASFVTRSRRIAEDEDGARVVVEGREDGRFLGWLTFASWDPDFRSAELGYVLTRDAWGHGYATEAARALLTWAYDALPLNRVQAQADTRNPASARVLEKLGFVLEGTLREDCIVDGVVSDSWVYGLLPRDWERAQASSASTSTS